METPAEGRRGPFWLSIAGQYDVDTGKVIRDNLENGIGSSVTLAREGRLTFDYNTESDSDVETGESG